MGDRFRFGPFLDDVEFYGFACLQGRRFGNVPAEHARLSAFDEVGRLGPGNAKHFGDRDVESFADERVGSGYETAHAAFAPSSVAFASSPSVLPLASSRSFWLNGSPRNSSSTAATPASMRKMSATLPMDHP